MSTYKTGNPLGSAAVKDLYDNAENLDHFENDRINEVYQNRLGVPSKTRFGMEMEHDRQITSQETRFQQFLNSSGYVFLGDYEDGPFQFSARNQYIRYNDQYYRLNATTDVGFTTTGTDATSFVNDVTHFVLMDGDTLRQNLGSGEPGMGADMLAFRDMLGRSSTVGDYLRDAYIRVHSRYELLQAIEHINNDLQHPAEIRLARNFASWNDAKTDIDITYASIVGEGGNVVIDAQGIPDAAGNYFMRIFNSKKSDINNLANIFTVKQQGLTVIGPGRNSNVAFNVFHSPEGQGAGFMTLGITAQEFGTGDIYQQNAYIIKHIGRAIQRCVNHVWMPSGYSNYGEGISYAHSLLSTSSGVGIRNDNANGAIRLFDCSLDYMGRIAVTNGGRIEIIGCHTEVNNASNKLTGIPFETASSQRAEIIIDGGEILGFNTPLPASVPVIFRCGAGTNGIRLRDVSLMNLDLPVGNYDINDGDGPFRTYGVTTIDGNGNVRVPVLKSERQNLLSDPKYTQPAIVDWYVTQDIAEVKDRTDCYGLKLTVSENTGSKTMRVQKIYGIGSLSEIKLRVPAVPGALTQYALLLKGEGIMGAPLTGNVFVEAEFSSPLHQNQYGTPLSARMMKTGPTRTIDAAMLTDWTRVYQQAIREYTPEWATHVLIKITLSSMSAGSLYIDQVRVTNL
ncbi:hypothetical protein [Klebsiella michiganensis]|uniref:hypothetical protein n=1 Tax=Klebsiella michiganensis TaxID=1134687 RepID=UPI002949CD16|nr:hypothetical protein [Klebsiella michiganensis]MDV5292493.1 hypothetical protein [Klebsiella michiganensis]MDV5344757.1 hypothetical protein [Klebsiella michiganensis]MDV5445208.1 hypothetical protein [Klebsiella michiganensis]